MIKKPLELGGDIWNLFKTINYKSLPAFLLDSSLYDEQAGRYSFMGWEPRAVFRSRGRFIEYQENGKWYSWEGDPLKELERVRKEASAKIGAYDYPFPFCGGLVGYISYDMGKNIVELKVKCHDDLQMYDQYWGWYDAIVVADHHNNQNWVVSHDDRNAKQLEEKIYQVMKNTTIKKDIPIWMGEISSNFTHHEYLDAIGQVKEYLRTGDIYQANLSQRFSFDFRGSSQDLYEIMRRINPAPFGAYLHFNEFDVLSMSPERFIKIRGGNIETRPIKGTRARGKNEEEDNLLDKELQQSEKDRAELLMIVDLERNDLGRICQTGSIRVEDLFKITRYSSVLHMDARVHGILKQGIGIDEVLRCTFPGGSITGAPKIKAMNIIEELEPTARGVYTGSIGYIDSQGNCDLNIAIRTVVVKNNRAYYQAGGGVVSDSDPELEYEETLAKTAVLFLAQKEVKRIADNK